MKPTETFNLKEGIVCQRFKPCEFLGFVWTDCWGDKSYYVITSPANNNAISCCYLALSHKDSNVPPTVDSINVTMQFDELFDVVLYIIKRSLQ